jgi:hypothetical protein
MNQITIFVTAAATLCVASAGNAQNMPGSGTGLIPQTYVPGRGLDTNKGGMSREALGLYHGPPTGVPAVPAAAAIQAAPLTQSKPGRTPHPEAIDNPAITGDPKPFKYGYGLSKFDASKPAKFDMLGRLQTDSALDDR